MMTKLLALSALTAAAAFAHCDSLDGPVVEAARRALSDGDVKLVLPWVQPDRESEIRQAFVQTVNVRKLGGEARELADTWFFETLVRVHRAGEGAPYDGLKPAGTIAPALRAADEAIAKSDLNALESALTTGIGRGLRERFSKVTAAKAYGADDVAAGRKYVAAYVDFIHFAERLGEALVVEKEHDTGHAH